jgi:predicted nucleotidyltransferase
MLTSDQVRAALEALAPTQEKVDLAVKTAVEVAKPSRVILFGSWPRGEAKWDSDLDLAVLMPDSHDLMRLVKALSGLGETLPATPLRLSDLNQFAVDYRYDLLYSTCRTQ